MAACQSVEWRSSRPHSCHRRSWPRDLNRYRYQGQAIGSVLTGVITRRTGLTVENAVVIDHDNLTVKDTGGSDSDKIFAFNDDGSQFTVEAEMNTADELVIDLPLLNT